jgi:monoamine oxidase
MTWMAAHAKFVAVYDQPFWRHQGLSGSVSSQTGPLVEIHDASSLHGKPALFGFVGINAAARKAAGRKALTQVVLNQLSDLFGEQAAKPVDTFLTDWSEETFTSTDQDQVASNSHPTYGLPVSADDLWNGHLLFAGTESARIAGGYLEGALEAAELATKKLTSSYS